MSSPVSRSPNVTLFITILTSAWQRAAEKEVNKPSGFASNRLQNDCLFTGQPLELPTLHAHQKFG
jgi:hypothetical protein